MISKLDFILLRFLLPKYQSTKINSLISTNNFIYSEFHYSELDQVLRIFHELYNISDKRQKEFPQILFHRFSPLFQFALPSFFFHYRIELIRRNERLMNGSLVTKAYPHVGCNERRGGLLRETLPPYTVLTSVCITLR